MSITPGSEALARRLNSLIERSEYKILERHIQLLHQWEVALKLSKDIPEGVRKTLELSDSDDLLSEPLTNTMLSPANIIDNMLFYVICNDDDAMHALINVTAIPFYNLNTIDGTGISTAILQAAVDDETIIYALQKYPKLCGIESRNVSPIWNAWRRPKVLETVIACYKKNNIAIPRNTTNMDSPHSVAVVNSYAKDDRAHQSLQLLLQAEPNPSEQTWLTLLSWHRQHLIDHYPVKITYDVRSTLGGMIDWKWTDEEIIAMVDKGAPIRATTNGWPMLHHLIIAKRWSLLIKLIDHFTREWNIGDLMNRSPLQILFRFNIKPSDNSTIRFKLNTDIPQTIIDEAIKRSDLRHTDINGVTVLTDLLLVMDTSTVFKDIHNRPFHVRSNRFGTGPLRLLTAAQRIELWDIAVDNFIYLAKKTTPHKTSDKLCADKPTKECREEILRRCKKTGICYPTPIHWAAVHMPVMHMEKTPTYFLADTSRKCLYNLTVMAQYDDLMCPFLYPDNEMVQTRDYMEKIVNGVPAHEPTKRLGFEYIFGTHTFDYVRITPVQPFDCKFDSAIRNALAQKKRWLFFMLVTDSNTLVPFRHANLVLVDLKENILERFDPNRTTGELQYERTVEKQIGVNLRRRLQTLLSEFRGKDVKLMYKTSTSMLNYPFGMSATNFDQGARVAYDPDGYCAAHCYLYLELRILNPDVPSEQIIGRLLKFEQKSGIDISELIRAYARTVNLRCAPYIRASGISEEGFFTYNYSEYFSEMLKYLDTFFFKFIVR
jgi:hypothetical protein